MTKEELFELAKEFVTATTEVLFATSDGNVFYEKHFAHNHSKAFNLEVYEFKVGATPKASKPKKTSRK